VVANAETVSIQHNLGGGFFESVSMLASGVEGWAVGHNGLVMHTADGGLTWAKQAVPAGLSVSGLFDVAAVDATHVWVAGRDSITNTPLMLFYNGAAWSQVTLPGVVTKRLMDVDMLNAAAGYAVSMDGFVLGTTDGATWSVLSTVAGGTAILRSIAHDPLAPSTLWTISDQGIYKSVDSGVTWSPEQSIGNFIDPDTAVPSAMPFGGRFLSVYGNTIVASDWGPGSIGQNGGGGAGILSSQDGGVTWTYVPWIAGHLLRPQMLSATVGYAVDWEFSDLNMVFKTMDGGLSWSPVASVGGVEWVDGMHFINQNVGWVVGENELIVKIDLNPGLANQKPVVVGDAYSTNQNTPLNVAAPGVLGNDSDVDGDVLSAAVVTVPANGTLVLNADGSFSYTPNAGFSGADAFTYAASDGNGGSAITSVNITVVAVTPPPGGDEEEGDDEHHDDSHDKAHHHDHDKSKQDKAHHGHDKSGHHKGHEDD